MWLTPHRFLVLHVCLTLVTAKVVCDLPQCYSVIRNAHTLRVPQSEHELQLRETCSRSCHDDSGEDGRTVLDKLRSVFGAGSGAGSGAGTRTFTQLPVPAPTLAVKGSWETSSYITESDDDDQDKTSPAENLHLFHFKQLLGRTAANFQLHSVFDPFPTLQHIQHWYSHLLLKHKYLELIHGLPFGFDSWRFVHDSSVAGEYHEIVATPQTAWDRFTGAICEQLDWWTSCRNGLNRMDFKGWERWALVVGSATSLLANAITLVSWLRKRLQTHATAAVLDPQSNALDQVTATVPKPATTEPVKNQYKPSSQIDSGFGNSTRLHDHETSLRKASGESQFVDQRPTSGEASAVIVDGNSREGDLQNPVAGVEVGADSFLNSIDSDLDDEITSSAEKTKYQLDPPPPPRDPAPILNTWASAHPNHGDRPHRSHQKFQHQQKTADKNGKAHSYPMGEADISVNGTPRSRPKRVRIVSDSQGSPQIVKYSHNAAQGNSIIPEQLQSNGISHEDLATHRNDNVSNHTLEQTLSGPEKAASLNPKIDAKPTAADHLSTPTSTQTQPLSQTSSTISGLPPLQILPSTTVPHTPILHSIQSSPDTTTTTSTNPKTPDSTRSYSDHHQTLETNTMLSRIDTMLKEIKTVTERTKSLTSPPRLRKASSNIGDYHYSHRTPLSTSTSNSSGSGFGSLSWSELSSAANTSVHANANANANIKNKSEGHGTGDEGTDKLSSSGYITLPVDSIHEFLNTINRYQRADVVQNEQRQTRRPEIQESPLASRSQAIQTDGTTSRFSMDVASPTHRTGVSSAAVRLAPSREVSAPGEGMDDSG